jgi:hypothetical protein
LSSSAENYLILRIFPECSCYVAILGGKVGMEK